MPEDEQAIAEELRRLLKASIAKRMMSDVPFGVFLSGGVDSTANVAMMAELMDQPVRTFSVGFRDNPEFNEIEEARFVANHYGTDHHEVIISQQELLDFLPDLIFHQDEPIADPYVCLCTTCRSLRRRPAQKSSRSVKDRMSFSAGIATTRCTSTCIAIFGGTSRGCPRQ